MNACPYCGRPHIAPIIAPIFGPIEGCSGPADPAASRTFSQHMAALPPETQDEVLGPEVAARLRAGEDVGEIVAKSIYAARPMTPAEVRAASKRDSHWEP